MYASTTVVATSDVIIKFYIISFSRDPIESEIPEEETSPVPEEKSEMEEAPIELLFGATL